jgi:hypothetical protein
MAPQPQAPMAVGSSACCCKMKQPKAAAPMKMPDARIMRPLEQRPAKNPSA